MSTSRSHIGGGDAPQQIVLKHTSRSNAMNNMYPDQNNGEPYLEITENAKQRGFRFRYTCEGPSHGGIPGCTSDRNKKTFPAVRICNYQGYARIVVQLVTNEENPRLHPHSLVGKQCQNGICTVQCGPRDMTATFPNLGIQHVTKKNVAHILEERYIAAEMQLTSINDGYPQDVQKNIKDEDRRRIAAKAQAEAKSIDLAVVRLMFIAYLPDSSGAFTIMLKPVISYPIYDSKAPNAATLKICRMDCNAGSACGGDEVYLLCDKVQKDDIQVRFFEENIAGATVWEALGNFQPTDVHRQFAIVFKTPPYRDQNIDSHVAVHVQLRRKSDQEVSEPRPFTYLPNSNSDFDGVEKKKRKIFTLQDMVANNRFISLTSNHQFFSLPGNQSQGNMGGGGQSNQGGNHDNLAKQQRKVAVAKKSRPQKQNFSQNAPIDPRTIFALTQKIESGKENTSAFVTLKQEKQSPLRESPAGENETKLFDEKINFIPGTQIPLPFQLKQNKPSLNYSQSSFVNSAEQHRYTPTEFTSNDSAVFSADASSLNNSPAHLFTPNSHTSFQHSPAQQPWQQPPPVYEQITPQGSPQFEELTTISEQDVSLVLNNIGEPPSYNNLNNFENLNYVEQWPNNEVNAFSNQTSFHNGLFTDTGVEKTQAKICADDVKHPTRDESEDSCDVTDSLQIITAAPTQIVRKEKYVSTCDVIASSVLEWILCDSPAKLDQKNTPLHASIISGNDQWTAKLLNFVSQVATLNQSNLDVNILKVAVECEDAVSVKLILEYMGNSNVMREWLQHEDSQSGDSILHLICSRDNCDILKVVVEKMTEVFGEESPQLRNMLLNVNYKGESLLDTCSTNSSLNCFKFLQNLNPISELINDQQTPIDANSYEDLSLIFESMQVNENNNSEERLTNSSSKHGAVLNKQVISLLKDNLSRLSQVELMSVYEHCALQSATSLHEQNIVDDILSALQKEDCDLYRLFVELLCHDKLDEQLMTAVNQSCVTVQAVC